MVFIHIISNLSSLYSNFDCDDTDTSSRHISVCKRKKEKGKMERGSNLLQPEITTGGLK